MDILKTRMSTDNLLLLSTKFKDVRNNNNIDYVVFKKKKLPWTETLNRIEHIIPSFLVKKLKDQK